MCGITVIINKNAELSGKNLAKANSIISHRGPDDEGFLLWRKNETAKIFAGGDTSQSSLAQHHLANLPFESTNWILGFGHRRLSILDLSPMGHQPMIFGDRFSITFNGEIFNYIEIREELLQLGCVFITDSDTEVILQAWAKWGLDALHKFNGMFAFAILDSQEEQLYLVRDRFGVKPLYFTETKSYVAFASEVKQLRTLPEYKFELNKQVAYEYLNNYVLDATSETFEVGIYQIQPGQYLKYDFKTSSSSKVKWYALPKEKFKGTDEEAILKFKQLLKESVKLRMRSDVPFGSALSGGLDSSTIVCLMREILTEQGFPETVPIKTITSRSTDKRFDEWHFAEKVIDQINAQAVEVFPTFEKLKTDVERLIWHMDYPFGSTSIFSQWCVFEAAKKAGITVMINGQGADEQLAGYAGNDTSLYIGLMRRGAFGNLLSEIKSFKKYKSKWPTIELIGAIQQALPKGVQQLIPQKYRFVKSVPRRFLRPQSEGKAKAWPQSLRDSLINQVTINPLPTLLRNEDRMSMAFSIESRVPFMDYRLIEFTLNLPENLVYRAGERKYILREAFRGIVPDSIMDRKDKMGFVSAEERWVAEEPASKVWFEETLAKCAEIGSELIYPEKANAFLKEIQTGREKFTLDPWHIVNFGMWLSMVKETQKAVSQV